MPGRRIVWLVCAVFLLTTLTPYISSAAEPAPGKKAQLSKKAKVKAKKGKKGAKKVAVTPPPGKGSRGRQIRQVSNPEVAQAKNGHGTLAIVKEMRHWSNPDYTRIAVTVDREVKFEQHRLQQSTNANTSSRMYIDILGGRIGHGVRDIQIGDGLLKTARIAQYRPDTVRVVLDLGSIKEYKVFTFSDPFSIIIDVKGARREEISRLRENVLTALPAPAATTLPPPVVKVERPEEATKAITRPAIGKIRRIVVDAGHGGHDPGAIGANGTQEKDVVLQIALMLARRLRDDLGLDVVLTRSTDVFLELKERTAIANQIGADLFVSIHANASPNRNTTGIETYYLNLAKTEKAAQLAAKENGTSLEKVSLLQAVLFDLMANYKLNDSALLAEEVQKSLVRKVSASYAGARNLGVKQGPFYVLVGATMPSILVETSFLSNERDEERLRDPQHQELTAEGIMDGIRGYIASVK